ERTVWLSAKRQATSDAFQSYLDRYPAGRFADEAKSELAALRDDPVERARRREEALELSRQDKRRIQQGLNILGFDPRGIDGIFGPASRAAIKRYQESLKVDETGYLRPKQIERLDELAAAKQAEIEAAAQARRKRLEEEDRALWQSTGASGSEEGLRRYLERNPDGLFAEAAQQRLDEIRIEKRRQARGAERQAWDDAVSAGNRAGFRAYLESFPNGQFVEEAKEALAELNDDRRQRAEAWQTAEQRLGLNSVTRVLVERRLTALGLEPGRADGTFDRSTRRAIRRFQRERELEVTGFLNEPTIVRMLADIGIAFSRN
ncbi:MAG: peptidoglycan-binding protein, partial [Pseudomonadota bacterium]